MNLRRAWVLSCWVCLGAGPAASPSLTGRVLLGFQGLTPASGMKVSSNGLNPTRTDDQGVFVLSLPPGSKPGTRIKIELVKAGHCILSPYNGEVVVPDDQGSARPVEIRLLRSDSRQSNSEDCIARFIEVVAQRPRSLMHREEKQAPIELPLELQAWASRQGVSLTAEQARAELTRWLDEVKAQPQRDPHVLGLARFAEKRFAEARQSFLQAATDAERQMDRARERLVENYRLAGDAASEEFNFDAALAAYENALKHVSRKSRPQQWAAVEVLLGNTHWQLGGVSALSSQ
jgi:hypothetical protein